MSASPTAAALAFARSLRLELASKASTPGRLGYRPAVALEQDREDASASPRRRARSSQRSSARKPRPFLVEHGAECPQVGAQPPVALGLVHAFRIVADTDHRIVRQQPVRRAAHEGLHELGHRRGGAVDGALTSIGVNSSTPSARAIFDGRPVGRSCGRIAGQAKPRSPGAAKAPVELDLHLAEVAARTGRRASSRIVVDPAMRAPARR